MSGLLGYIGAGAGGAAEGLMQRQQMETQQRDLAMRELMAGLQQRQAQRQMEAAPPEFMQGLEPFAPGVSQVQGASRDEALQIVNGYRAPGTTRAGKDYDRELELINARGAQARQTRQTRPGGDEPSREELIVKYTSMLKDLDRVPPEMFNVLLQNDPRFSGMSADKKATRAFILARLKDLGVGPDGVDMAPVSAAPAPAPSGAPAPSATPAPKATLRFNPQTGKLEPIE